MSRNESILFIMWAYYLHADRTVVDTADIRSLIRAELPDLDCDNGIWRRHMKQLMRRNLINDRSGNRTDEPDDLRRTPTQICLTAAGRINARRIYEQHERRKNK